MCCKRYLEDEMRALNATHQATQNRFLYVTPVQTEALARPLYNVVLIAIE